MNIGKSVHIKGELTGNEDLTIDGTVEGKIVLSDHNLTIGANARITAEVSALSVVVIGRVVGDIRAQERIEVRDGGTVDGDLIAPRVVLSEGARFRGSIDMLTGKDPASRSDSPSAPVSGSEPASESTPERESKPEPERDSEPAAQPESRSEARPESRFAFPPAPAPFTLDEVDDMPDDLVEEIVDDMVDDVIEIDEFFEERPAWAEGTDEDDQDAAVAEDGKGGSEDQVDEIRVDEDRVETQKGEAGDEERTRGDKLADIFDEFDPSNP